MSLATGSINYAREAEHTAAPGEGAAQLRRQMASARRGLQHPALDRNRPQQRRHNQCASIVR
jgi:hypothetical protein